MVVHHPCKLGPPWDTVADLLWASRRSNLREFYLSLISVLYEHYSLSHCSSFSSLLVGNFVENLYEVMTTTGNPFKVSGSKWIWVGKALHTSLLVEEGINILFLLPDSIYHQSPTLPSYQFGIAEATKEKGNLQLSAKERQDFLDFDEQFRNA